MKNPRIIAMCGKGGVGKTTTAALMIKAMADKGNKKILAIDADPAFGLSYALGVDVVKTVDDVRHDLIAKIRDDKVDDKADTLHMLDYEIFDALVQQKHFSLLAIGRPEGEGCYCEVNHLLKDIIESLAVNFDAVVIDGEAGIEQINRRVMKKVDHLILISDTSAKGLNVAGIIKKVAHNNQAVDYKSVGLLINRIIDKDEVDAIMNHVELDLLGWIPEDDLVREFDFKGRSYLDFPVDSPTSAVIRQILASIG
ncbi:MAG: AAA family ATPase, partial [Proteobacteria bacterium]|nr:AAA family ATPase [Pseudomonadota bacterium]